MEISEEEKKLLLSAARNSIKSFFDGEEYKPIDFNLYPGLKQNLGAFVTLKIDDTLRGCIGYVFSQESLYDTVCEAAKQSAFCDPRFFPLTREEFEKVKIEISILSPPQKINNYDEIIIGKHGLILEEGKIRAILLPQVAVAHNFLREQFLSALCEKGGLPPAAWQLQKLNLMVFTAEVFSEDDK